MRLLISNDDGIYAKGVRTLANTMAEAGHDVSVVCPDRERSATGHGLTLHQPIRAEIVESIFHPKIKAWACDGTPSDCVKLALWALLDSPPQLVLSGINQGANLGTEILYSGTVSAAMEGLIEGIPSIAFSLTSYSSSNFEVGADFAKTLVEQLSQKAKLDSMLLNVNIPAVESSQIKGVKFTRQGVRRYVDVFNKRVDPRGKTYYWLTGEVLEDVEPPVNYNLPENIPIDVSVVQDNYISITPLHYNLTYADGFKQLAQRELQFNSNI
ncbi:MAG: 5'/3'-nucleotidase SurE [Rivularia sp. (in: Bacteria)]|nr:5'/3'-nucleotidase SurE [Rivularia sp. MS3]